MNFSGELVRVIGSFLAERSFRIKKDVAVSGWIPMLTGVPQESYLSPLLYNLYTSDIPKYIVSELSLYADDICIYDQTKKPKYAYVSMQHHFNGIGRWANRSRIKINCEKCCVIPFSWKNKINVYLDYVLECSYLGVHQQRRLNWTKHCEVMRTKALSILGKLIPLLKLSLP